ncbi:MAG: 4-oxalocrotonate tautomerase [Microbacteriaceae bacterium]|jgi:4-oxalocrotonate tautomerase|nr:4-oxalocrotonate tautomerase [Microbacteriaceae bacterium]
MPLINIRVPEGSLSQEKKERMIELVTDAVVEAEGMGDAVRPITWVIIDEVKDGSWGAAGRAVRLADLAKLVKGGREAVQAAATPG